MCYGMQNRDKDKCNPFHNHSSCGAKNWKPACANTGHKMRKLPVTYPPFQTCHRRSSSGCAEGSRGRYPARVIFALKYTASFPSKQYPEEEKLASAIVRIYMSKLFESRLNRVGWIDIPIPRKDVLLKYRPVGH